VLSQSRLERAAAAKIGGPTGSQIVTVLVSKTELRQSWRGYHSNEARHFAVFE
jgi:hypothetical protein